MKKSLLAVIAAMLTSGAALAQGNDTLSKVNASGRITMGVRDSSGALSYRLGDGQYGGYHHEVCLRIVDRLEKELGKKLDIKYQPVTSQNRIPLLRRGKIDIECGSTTNSAARQNFAAFALTTFMEEVRFAVKTNSGITQSSQLGGKHVTTTTGTTSLQMLRKNVRASGVNFNEVFGKDHSDSFSLLASGGADAFVMDASILAGSIAAAPNPAEFRIADEVLSIEPIAIMLRKDDPAFKKLADDTIRSLIKSGDMAKLYDKWFMQPIPPANIRIGWPASEALKAAWAMPNDKPMEAYGKK